MINRIGYVYFKTSFAGILEETDTGYKFTYEKTYIKKTDSEPISLTLPIQKKPFISKTFFPFFDGLIPEGWLLDVVIKNWKINPNDRMGLVLVCCYDCIGAVSIYPEKKDEI